jgi:hypothetical protein
LRAGGATTTSSPGCAAVSGAPRAASPGGGVGAARAAGAGERSSCEGRNSGAPAPGGGGSGCDWIVLRWGGLAGCALGACTGGRALRSPGGNGWPGGGPLRSNGGSG